MYGFFRFIKKKKFQKLLFQICHSTVYLVIVYFATGQPLEMWRFSMYYAISLMNSLVAQSVGLAIGILFTIEVLKNKKL